jgi:hypothetical protein
VRGCLDRVKKPLNFAFDKRRCFPFGPSKSLGLDFPGRIHGQDAFFGLAVAMEPDPELGIRFHYSRCPLVENDNHIEAGERWQQIERYDENARMGGLVHFVDRPNNGNTY